MTVRKPKQKRAARNRTINIGVTEASDYRKRLVKIDKETELGGLLDQVLVGDALEIIDKLPENSFDLLFADPPYNLSKVFGKKSFRQKSLEDYEEWLDSWIKKVKRVLKPTASVYVCGDWRSAAAIQRVGMKYFKLRNRITWEREKGRGSKTNWKNASEDIWFFTVSDDYRFDAEAVKMKKRVIAPYKENGRPKDWKQSRNGKFRLTHPSNLWNDLTVPFWSMPENTDHPTQKPEKLLAKIILASTTENDVILDPFAGSGTTGVVARKLKRKFVSIEEDEKYCMLALKRLDLAEEDPSIQGFADGVFWERNSQIKR